MSGEFAVDISAYPIFYTNGCYLSTHTASGFNLGDVGGFVRAVKLTSALQTPGA